MNAPQHSSLWLLGYFYLVSLLSNSHVLNKTSVNCQNDTKGMTETTEQDLVNAVRESLRQDGRLGRFKAELRSAVMSILNKNPADKNPVHTPEETKLINELIREYLTWNGYLYSEQVLAAESGQHGERLPRENLGAKLNVVDDERTSKIPLLYYVVAAFQNQDNDSDNT